MADHGFCDYCHQRTYHDLWHGACADCLLIWRNYPDTTPAAIQRFTCKSIIRTYSNFGSGGYFYYLYADDSGHAVGCLREMPAVKTVHFTEDPGTRKPAAVLVDPETVEMVNF